MLVHISQMRSICLYMYPLCLYMLQYVYICWLQVWSICFSYASYMLLICLFISHRCALYACICIPYSCICCNTFTYPAFKYDPYASQMLCIYSPYSPMRFRCQDNQRPRRKRVKGRASVLMKPNTRTAHQCGKCSSS